MYKLPVFTTDNQDEVLDFMHKNDFITLIGFDGAFPIATQVPVETTVSEGQIKLVGHMMKKTNHFRAFEKMPNALAVFTGPHTYISASVYETPASASTWNYMTVQAKGILRLMSDDETYQVVKNLTDKYEHPNTSPASFDKMTEEYIQKNLKAISGFEISVTQLDHVFKMSQNHSTKNRENIVKHLEKSDDFLAKEVAKEMKKNL